MKTRFRRYRLFIAALAFYVAGASFYSWLEYRQIKQSALDALNERLLVTVSLAEHLLQQKMRDHLTGNIPMTPDEAFFVSLELQELADYMRVTNIYSLIQKNSLFLYTSATPKDDSSEPTGKSYANRFMEPYGQSSGVLQKVFAIKAPEYVAINDGNNEYQSIFFPFENINGDVYVIGVDAKRQGINQLASASLFQAIIYGSFLGLIVFPLIYLYIRSLNKSYRQQLDFISTHPLTGLPNQRYLETKLTNTHVDHLLLIEIENFDYLVSVLGVAATDDMVLRLVFRLTELQVPNIEYCQWFHLADDRFALFSTYDYSDHQVKVIVTAIYQSITGFTAGFDVDDQVPLVIRMGAVKNQQNALMFANMALVHAKQTNQTFVNYEDCLSLPNYFRRYIDTFNLLSNALRNSHVTVFFQPILDVSSSQIVKYEALVRLLDNEGNIVSSPDEFMPIAYQSRLCHKLTRVVLDQVIEKIKPTKHIVSINLSVKDLFDQKTREYLVQTIRKSNVGEQLEFELLEQQAINNYSLAAAYIKQLKSCVNAVGMDDLGKLYSNFDRLITLPIDFVKIDGLIVEAMARDSDAKTVIEGIVSFSQHKGIHVIAEHCSSQSICDMLVLMNVDLLQGFHIGLPNDKFEIKAPEKTGEFE